MNMIKEITLVYQKLAEKENIRYLLFFLFINLLFMFVEVLYGLLSNSLGLLTDGAHMLLDCSAIIIGLYSSYLSDKKPNSEYNFGYNRSEVLGTFINSVFLIFIALYIVFESVERIIHPVVIHSDNLILVSFLGLLVNLVGVYYLHGSHEHSPSISCGHSHGVLEEQVDIEIACSHGDGHEHSHDHKHEKKEDAEYNENLYAIYIHILADALGSVSVLISSFLIRFYGLTFTDPLCSFLISILIIYSSWPVLKSSTYTLLHFLPQKMVNKKNKIEKEVKYYFYLNIDYYYWFK